mgnify:CR=1 FL=1
MTAEPAMRIDVVTIFPEYLDPFRHALLGKAIENQILRVGVHNLRQWTHDVHQAVDSTPCGGGPGMVMKPEVWGSALDDIAAGTGPAAEATDLESATPHKGSTGAGGVGIKEETGCAQEVRAQEKTKPLLVVPTPAGAPFTQDMAQRWSKEQHVVFACGRYEGIDQRVVEDAANRYRVEEVSIGDYVLIGGEVAVLVMAEAMVRLIPGVLGNRASHEEDSFQDGLLEGPSYTRPRQWRGLEVPEVLFSGNHAKIEQWRREQSLLRTRQRRPELLEQVELSKSDRQVLGWD